MKNTNTAKNPSRFSAVLNGKYGFISAMSCVIAFVSLIFAFNVESARNSCLLIAVFAIAATVGCGLAAQKNEKSHVLRWIGIWLALVVALSFVVFVLWFFYQLSQLKI